LLEKLAKRVPRIYNALEKGERGGGGFGIMVIKEIMGVCMD